MFSSRAADVLESLQLPMLTLLTVPWAHGGQTTSRAGRVGEQHQQRSEATGTWADCQWEMAHGTEQRNYARAL